MTKRTITNKEFTGLVAKICRDIANREWRPEYVVGLGSGSLVPSAMIGNYFDLPVQIIPENESNLWVAEEAFGYVHYEGDTVPVPTDRVRSNPSKRKNILVVTDINDTGKNINDLMEDWRTSCLPNDPAWKDVWNNNVKFAVIFDNVASKSKVTMDYCGEEITKGKKDTIVFPYENWWV